MRVPGSGPARAKLAILGEAPGEEEDKIGQPFVGASGQELTRMLADAGLQRRDIFLTNVFDQRPPGNKLVEWAVPKKDSGGGPWPSIAQGKYLPSSLWLEAQERVSAELGRVQPNLLICLGNTASILALHSGSISKIRGAVAHSPVFNLKILPTYHPAAVLRSWDLRSIVVLDFIKARNEQEFPDLRFPDRLIHIAESRADFNEILQWALLQDRLSIDIETARGQITCVGFGTPWRSYVIPICWVNKPGHLWSFDDELAAVLTIKAICESPVEKVGQNLLYDIQYLYRLYGIRVNNFQHDTMIAHHIYMPELQKSLGFLGAAYADVPAWKFLRARGQTEGKRDDE